MTNKEVMQQALEALVTVSIDAKTTPTAYEAQRQAITALREELAKPEQEPFGYFKAEPFGWTDCAETDEGAKALYEAPPAQRQPLTDEELEKVFPAIATYHEANKTLYRSIARAIEAAHGIKEKT